MTKPTTIKDIAREADVSLATVSRALNHDPAVSEKMQRRVMKAAKKLNYVANSAAKSLKTNRSYTIGFLVSDISNDYYITIAKAVEDMVEGYHYNLILCSTNNHREREEEYLNMLMSRNVDGLILNTTGFNDDLIAKMNKKVPIVLLNRKIYNNEFCGDLVDTNSYAGCYQLTKQLLALGHRKIYVVRGPAHLSTSVERFKGFTDAMEEAGMAIGSDYPYVYMGEFTRKSGIAAVEQFFEFEEKPTAILSQNNMTTVGVLEALRRTDLRIPEDLSLVSYDAIGNRELMALRPTSAEFDMPAIGAQVGQAILERMKEPDAPSKEYIFEPKIVSGNSLGLARMG